MIQGQNWNESPSPLPPRSYHLSILTHPFSVLFGFHIAEITNLINTKGTYPKNFSRLQMPDPVRAPKNSIHRMSQGCQSQWLSQDVFIRSLRQTHVLRNANMISQAPLQLWQAGPLPLPLPFLSSDKGQASPFTKLGTPPEARKVPTKTAILPISWCVTSVSWINRNGPQCSGESLY
jgi:hypothetical protein